jgi:hypothetical protein
MPPAFYYNTARVSLDGNVEDVAASAAFDPNDLADFLF